MMRFLKENIEGLESKRAQILGMRLFNNNPLDVQRFFGLADDPNMIGTETLFQLLHFVRDDLAVDQPATPKPRIRKMTKNKLLPDATGPSDNDQQVKRATRSPPASHGLGASASAAQPAEASVFLNHVMPEMSSPSNLSLRDAHQLDGKMERVSGSESQASRAQIARDWGTLVEAELKTAKTDVEIRELVSKIADQLCDDADKTVDQHERAHKRFSVERETKLLQGIKRRKLDELDAVTKKDDADHLAKTKAHVAEFKAKMERCSKEREALRKSREGEAERKYKDLERNEADALRRQMDAEFEQSRKQLIQTTLQRHSDALSQSVVGARLAASVLVEAIGRLVSGTKRKL